MKKLLTLLVLVIPLVSQAQMQGSIIFKEERKLELNFDGPEGQQLKSQMPESISSNNELVYNENHSIFRDHKDKASEDIQSLNPDNEGGMIVNFKRPQSFVFRDIEDVKLVESREFFGKQFLITDNSENEWKLTEGTQTILGYECKKAVMNSGNSQESITAWYTSQIPVATGPATYGGLPGLILKVEIDNGKLTYTAEKFVGEKIDPSVLKAPKNGKKVSREEFQKIVEVRMAEQKEMTGHSGGMMIRRIETQ